MPLQSNGAAPYTTSTTAVAVIEAYRERGLGVPVTSDVLIRAGVPESLARRTLHSLKQLDLLGEDREPTEIFKTLRQARGQEEFTGQLQEWVKLVYGEVLQYTDPSKDAPDRVAEAFRTYEPSGQRRAMASLLIGLWRYAGFPMPEEGSLLPARRQPAARAASSPKRPAAAPSKASPSRSRVTPIGMSEQTSVGSTPLSMGGLPEGLVGLLHQIPRNGGSWTTQRRDAFLAAFTAVLNFSVQVDDNPVAATPVDEDDDD